jgi:hypothetical protein
MRGCCHKYEEKLSISYYYKENSGPETLELRNEKKQGLLYHIRFRLYYSNEYLTEVDKALKENYVALGS